jgi:hypothetical protein
VNKAVRLLRISYWVGAVLDAINVIPLAFPELGAKMLGLADLKMSPEFNYVSYIGASLMLGWTILLIWADRKPIERMGVLLITVFPVVLGIAVSGIYLYIIGTLSLASLLPLLILQICITSLFLFSYFYARSCIRKTQDYL